MAFANCHSHACHRALRGRTHAGGGTFWTWREQMYALAAVLDPDLLHDLAKATYAEMALAGISTVGEFHYLHHGPDGTPYDDPNAMGEALIAAAREAGLRIALLDTCYVNAGFGAPAEGVQRGFSDGDAERWANRVEDLAARYVGATDVVIGTAIHSVRAVPADQLSVVAQAIPGSPLHVHVSEQPAENDECVAATGMTPTALLDKKGVWSERTTAVHATHLAGPDIETLGAQNGFVCFCPTTERDLADGVGPSRQLHEAGARLTLGSDSNAVIDMFEEMRAVEMDERLVSGNRGTWAATELICAATATGHESLGFADAGREIDIDWGSPRLAGVPQDDAGLVFAANAGDVTSDFDPDIVARDLRDAIAKCWSRV